MPTTLPVNSLRPGDHICWRYEDGSHREVVSSFINNGLRANELVLYLTSVHTDDEIRDYVDETALGRLDIMPISEVFAAVPFEASEKIAFLREQEETALNNGFTAFRLAAEIPSGLDSSDGLESLVTFETRAHDFFAGKTSVGLCQYASDFGVNSFNRIRSVHNYWLEDAKSADNGLLEISWMDEPPGLRLRGEVDASNCADLAAALTTRTDTNTDMYLDMSEVEFMDAGALRLVFRAADRLNSEHHVIVRSPSVAVRRLLAICDPGGVIEVKP